MEQQPGKGAATASLVLGIISLVAAWFGWVALISIGCGIAGIICAANAKKAGFVGGMRTAGLVMSVIGLILGGIVFVACTLCTACAAAAVGSMSSNELQSILNQYGY